MFGAIEGEVGIYPVVRIAAAVGIAAN